ncbi:MAG: PHP domain-containing protein [Anaerolineales bacterium]|nr:PHP domain-containing protein [Anaerolineales bacterium]
MFVHLHAHSNYSFLDGVPSPRALAERAAHLGMPALALTDHHGLTGAIEFYTTCRDVGVHPILGLEISVNHPWGLGNLILLAKNLEGWGNLCRLSSLLQTAPHRDPARGLPFEPIAQHATGLICLTGGPRGLLDTFIARQQNAHAHTWLRQLAETFPDHLYVELQSHRPADREHVNAVATLAGEHHLPLVATHNVHFLAPEQAPLQRLLASIRQNTPLKTLSPHHIAPETALFATAEELAPRFAAYPEALANTLEIAARLFFAQHDTRTPMFIALLWLIINISCAYWLVGPLGVGGLALASTVAFTVQSAVLLYLNHLRLDGLDWRDLATGAGRILLAAAGMGVVMWGIGRFLTAPLLFLPVAAAVGGLVYLLLHFLLGGREIPTLVALVRRHRRE